MNDFVIYNEQQYKDSFKEVLTILEYIPKKDFEKIPKDIVITLKNTANDLYNFSLDLKKSLKEQNLSEITKAILENFYRDYWVTSVERKMILNEEKIKRQQIDREKKERYNPDNLFKNNVQKQTKQEKVENKCLVVVYKESFIKKIINKLKKLWS